MSSEVVFGEESLVALLTHKIPAAFVGVQMLFKVVGLDEMLVAFRTLYLTFLCVGEHVLL